MTTMQDVDEDGDGKEKKKRRNRGKMDSSVHPIDEVKRSPAASEADGEECRALVMGIIASNAVEFSS